MQVLKSQDIREFVRLTGETTVAELATVLGWTLARTQMELYHAGGGIMTNTSVVDFKAARVLIRQVGRDARLGDNQAIVHYLEAAQEVPSPRDTLPLWKQRAHAWLSLAIQNFNEPGRLPLETAVAFADMAVTQLILGAGVIQGDSQTTDMLAQAETPRFEWRTILNGFAFPNRENLDALEISFLNDLHAARNDVIHGTANFDLYRESVYIWLFLVAALACQFNAGLDRSSPGIAPFLPATRWANLPIREGCQHWLANFIPTLVESALGSVKVEQNQAGKWGFSDDDGQAFIPDLIITGEDGQRYSAQVEIPVTINMKTASWWQHYQPSLVFVPLGYLGQARFFARQVGYPLNRLMAFISPGMDSVTP